MASEIESRFEENDQDVLYSLTTIVMEPEKTDVENEAVKICGFYDIDKDHLLSERKIVEGLLKEDETNALGSSSNLIQWLHLNKINDLLPAYSEVASYLGSIPATSCSPERSFSALRRIKSYLRAQMGQEHLLDISILHIERKETNMVLEKDIKEMIDSFAARSNRGQLLLH
jgi:hypothetical protein